MKTIIIGDIHGNLIGLNQVLERSGYNPKEDRLITMGDYVDGYPESAGVIDLLIRLQEQSEGKNIHLLGNHDEWTLELLTYLRHTILKENIAEVSFKWSHAWNQGGRNTFFSYLHSKEKVDFNSHVEFLQSLKWYHIEDNIAFVHGGWRYDAVQNIEEQYALNKTDLIWDRSLWARAQHLQDLLDKSYPVSEDKCNFGQYNKVFIGHTATSFDYINALAVKCCNIINVDAGSGFDGRLIGYELNSGEIYAADYSQQIYKNIQPRNG